MARPKLTVEAEERSTYVITLAFADAAGAAVTPDSLAWTLTDGAGTVINGRSNVAVAPAPTVRVVLSGSDLALQASEGALAMRLLLIAATYTSTEGSGLPLREEYAFTLRGLVAVT